MALHQIIEGDVESLYISRPTERIEEPCGANGKDPCPAYHYKYVGPAQYFCVDGGIQKEITKDHFDDLMGKVMKR